VNPVTTASRDDSNLRQNKPNRKVRISAIALPGEHGSWGFLFEPIIAAVVIVPSRLAIGVVLVYVGAFLARQPLKVLLSDWQSDRRLPQTVFALLFVFLFGILFWLGIADGYFFGKVEYYYPAVSVIPFGAYQVYCDVGRKTRHLIPELTGSVAISSSAAVIALTGGWSLVPALALWGIVVGRLIPSILYVRNRLRLEKGKEFSTLQVFGSHLAVALAAVFLSVYGLASKLTAAVFVLLMLRAVFGLSSYRTKMKAMKIGLWEVFYGLLTVLSIIMGYYLNI